MACATPMPALSSGIVHYVSGDYAAPAPLTRFGRRRIPASGRHRKDEASRHSTRPGPVSVLPRLGACSKYQNERNHRHDYPAQHLSAGPVRHSRRRGGEEKRAVSAQLSPEDVDAKYFDCSTRPP